MKITIEPTDVTTTLDGVPVRLWDGVTDDGVPCKLFIHRVAVRDDQDCAAFERRLREQLPPAGLRVVPLHMIL